MLRSRPSSTCSRATSTPNRSPASCSRRSRARAASSSCRRITSRDSPKCVRGTGSCSSPTRCSRAWGGPGRCGRSSTMTASSQICSCRANRSAAACPWRRSRAARRSWTPQSPAASVGLSGGTPSRAPRPRSCSTLWPSLRSAPGPTSSASRCALGSTISLRATSRSGRCAASARCSRSNCAHRARSSPRRSPPPPSSGACSCSRVGSTATCSGCCPRSTSRTRSSIAASGCWRKRLSQPAEIDVRVVGLRKRYGDVTAVDGVDLEIGRGEFFTMLGPSGSGKTTTLRMIAGFEHPDEGTVELGGKDVSQLPPYARDVNTVFQDYALFPHMTVQENVEYGLRVKKVARGERRRRAGEALALVQLESYGGRKPGQLSGGQRQRVALARAIVNRPQALLLDEPLGALDLKLRQQLQVELKQIQQEVGITFVYVTHDQEEALTMSDRLAVFNAGRVEQIGAPADVYEHPASEFIAGFVGVSNVLERDGRRFTVRPEKIRMLGDGEHPEGAHVEEGRIRDVVYVGAITRYHVELDAGGELTVVSQNLESGSSEVLERQG